MFDLNIVKVDMRLSVSDNQKAQGNYRFQYKITRLSAVAGVDHICLPMLQPFTSCLPQVFGTRTARPRLPLRCTAVRVEHAEPVLEYLRHTTPSRVVPKPPFKQPVKSMQLGHCVSTGLFATHCGMDHVFR